MPAKACPRESDAKAGAGTQDEEYRVGDPLGSRLRGNDTMVVCDAAMLLLIKLPGLPLAL
jgi:hypothetical protein